MSEGSPVYACSLDAEGAFDCIPHPILFRKCFSAIPDSLWRLLVVWYRKLTVRIRWREQLSSEIQVLQGTRQGGLSSPFLFNLFYQDLIERLAKIPNGIQVNGKSYNTFCYADDILVTSLTSSGLQKLITTANEIITSQGLRFNPSKTVCCTFGQSTLSPKPQWTLNGEVLKQEESLVYLGVTLSNNKDAHTNARIRACQRAFFSLQGAGLRPHGLSPETMKHLWMVAVRPVLFYGMHCTHLGKEAIKKIRSTEAKLLKRALGLRKFCKSTPLLDALDIPDIHLTLKKSRLKTLMSALRSQSQASHFYAYALTKLRLGQQPDPNSLVGQLVQQMSPRDVLNAVANERLPLRKPSSSEPSGVVDSVRQLLMHYSSTNNELLNMMLSPF